MGKACRVGAVNRAVGRARVECAPAKLTLSLRVTGRRADGLHLIEAEMISLDLEDTLEFGAGNGISVVDEVAGHGSPLPVTAGGDNLVARALKAVGRRAAVTLTKRIPAGAGLGGGSADAAAVLRWAGLTGESEAELALAARLGADVPFCLRGGRARVTGIGDVVEDLPCGPSTSFTLLTPPLPVSTAAAYRAWDAMGGPTADGPNDLEPAALAVEPRLQEWRDRLGDATGQEPVLAGSGSTWWVTGAYPGVAGTVVVRSACPSRPDAP